METKACLLFLILWGVSGPLFSQEKALKEYADHHNKRKFALYASTLRMVNLEKNPAFNELVQGVEKLLIYVLDSAATASKSYLALEKEFRDDQFEEYVKAYGGTSDWLLMGKELRKANEFIGFIGQDEGVVAFYFRGTLQWQKIPEIVRTMQTSEIMNLLSIND